MTELPTAAAEPQRRPEGVAKRRHYPTRATYLEHSLTEREMRRL